MQVNVGIDIIEVDRVKKSIEELGNKFIDKVFTQKEIDYCSNKKISKYQHYAARFAAKEAAFKAVSTLLKDKYSISWKNMQVVNDEKGKPKLEFIFLEKNVENELKKIASIDLSISHIKDYAVANVTILTN